MSDYQVRDECAVCGNNGANNVDDDDDDADGDDKKWRC